MRTRSAGLPKILRLRTATSHVPTLRCQGCRFFRKRPMTRSSPSAASSEQVAHLLRRILQIVVEGDRVVTDAVAQPAQNRGVLAVVRSRSIATIRGLARAHRSTTDQVSSRLPSFTTTTSYSSPTDARNASVRVIVSPTTKGRC